MKELTKEPYRSGPDSRNIPKSREELLRIIKQLRESLGEVSFYMDHLFGCEEYYTDVCTCGKVRVMDSARKIHKETQYL